MTRTSLLILLMIFPLVQGCQQHLSEDYESEIKMNISNMQPDQQCTEFSSENGNRLTEEEAMRALLWMIAKKEARSKALANVDNEKKEAMLKIMEENKRKEKELLEMVEHNEDLNESLQKLSDETDVQIREMISYYNEKYALVENTNKEFRDYAESRDTEYNMLFEDFVVITTPQINYPERNENWECDLKEGLFRRLIHGIHGSFIEFGRFKKDDNGEWIAIETGWKMVVCDPDTDTWKPYTLE